MNSKLVCLVAVLCLPAVTSGADVASPVEQIVNLLKSLKDKTVGDGKHEQQIYDKYACWCETTSKRKADDIVQAQADLRSLGQRILKLKGTVATRDHEISELNDEIQANTNEQEALTAVREKQNAAWAAESDEVKQALAALQKAIKVLASATTPKAAGFIQEDLEVQVKMSVNAVLDKLPSRVSLPRERMALLTEFTQGKAAYAPQSATIQGMLGDMYLTFSANLESDTLEEANRNSDYEKATADLETSSNKKRDTRDRKSTEKAEAESMLADTTKAYDDTEKQMKADEEFFDKTKAACEDKHEEWEIRVKMRNEEIDGIEKALEILTSDEAREQFATSIKPGVGFLQIASTPALLQDSALAPAARAYNALKGSIKKGHSVRLAALAVRIRTSKAGHFDKVIADIDRMLKTLADEGAADLAKKEQCQEENQQITRTLNKLDWKIKNNEAKIAKFEKLIELRTEAKDAANQKIKETQEYIKTITAERKAENEDYIQAKKDDNAAIDLLTKAKDVFMKYMKKHGAALLSEPEFARSKDDAPDATFSSKGNNKGKSDGIVALFDYILEDLADELKNSKKDEATAQADFAEELATAEKLVSDLKAKVDGLKDIIAKRTTDKTEENTDKKENNIDRDDELKYQAKIKPDCDWIMKNFDGRATARAAEADGLTTAKEFLAGRTALLQKKKFDDNALSRIGFLGISK